MEAQLLEGEDVWLEMGVDWECEQLHPDEKFKGRPKDTNFWLNKDEGEIDDIMDGNKWM